MDNVLSNILFTGYTEAKEELMTAFYRLIETVLADINEKISKWGIRSQYGIVDAIYNVHGRICCTRILLASL